MNPNNDPQDLWKTNDPELPRTPASSGICALARREERTNGWLRGICLFALACFAVAFAHNTWVIDQPWVRLGQGWMLTIITVYLFGVIRDRTGRRASSETCAGFLLRSFKMKRDGFLAVRRVVLLIIPAVLASWWGGGAALRARAMGLDPSSLYYRYMTSNWPMVATCFLLLLVWVGFSGAARKASAEFEEFRERIAIP
jgi:hypothetical protein